MQQGISACHHGWLPGVGLVQLHSICTSADGFKMTSCTQSCLFACCCCCCCPAVRLPGWHPWSAEGWLGVLPDQQGAGLDHEQQRGELAPPVCVTLHTLFPPESKDTCSRVLLCIQQLKHACDAAGCSVAALSCLWDYQPARCSVVCQTQLSWQLQLLPTGLCIPHMAAHHMHIRSATPLPLVLAW